MIADALKQAHGEGTVFMDVESVAMGARWPDRIRAALAEAERVVVVIGRGWQYGRRRIDDPDDWVRLEISLALSDASKRVIPVLVDDAELPPAEVIPECVSGITSCQAVVLRHDHWD